MLSLLHCITHILNEYSISRSKHRERRSRNEQSNTLCKQMHMKNNTIIINKQDEIKMA